MVYPDSERYEQLLRVAFDIMERHAYRRIITPVMESTELFSRTIGEHTDIVTKEMYTFEDRGGDMLTLRPEGTAPVMRAYLERGLFERGLPQKVYYSGPMFRRERPQAGRLRQFHQIGAEAIGSDDPFTDAEIISISDIYFRTLGLAGYELVMNSVGCPDCRPAYVELLRDFLGGAQGLCEKCQKRVTENPLRVLDCKEERCREATATAPLIGDSLCAPCREHFDRVLQHLETMGIAHVLDQRMVRGLDYYVRTAFEFRFEGLGAQNTVCGGGRYDYLAEELGGSHTPGVGYSLGMERLMMALDAAGIVDFVPERLDVFVATIKEDGREAGLRMLGELRWAGASADTDHMGRSLKAQMKQASRLGARYALIFGGDELARGEVLIRDLDASEQWPVKAIEAVSRTMDLLRDKRNEDGD
jgi:histidyl-tRNA synthetase